MTYSTYSVADNSIRGLLQINVRGERIRPPEVAFERLLISQAEVKHSRPVAT